MRGAQRQAEGRARTAQHGVVSEAIKGRLATIVAMITQPIVNDLPFGYQVFVNDGSGVVQVFVCLDRNRRELVTVRPDSTCSWLQQPVRPSSRSRPARSRRYSGSVEPSIEEASYQ